jgi:arabinan endo-1,5-alpha-L-arabinosidase
MSFRPSYSSCLTIALALTPLLILGCSGSGNSSGGGTSAPPPVVGTTTSLATSATGINTGASLTLTATVVLSSSGPASGTVTFLDGATSLGSSALNSSGVATYTTSTLAAGTHSFTASFAGSSTETASTSSAVSVTVSVPGITTNVTGTWTGTPRVGRPLELAANITASSGTTLPTGAITFLDGATRLATVTLDATGHAMTTVTTLVAGAHTLTASYAGTSTFAASTGALPALTVPAVSTASFTNPLTLQITNGTAISCADPATIKAQTSGKDTWYLYCTSDALYAGDPATHYINVFESTDLVHWTYDGNAFNGLPSWAPSGASWAPAIKYMNGQYFLYYTSPSSNQDAPGGAAIGVGTSASPKGPFVDHGSPVVEPEPTTDGCCGGADRSTIDPDVVADSTGQLYITFGSFSGGIFARKLSSDGFTSDKTSEVQIAATERYEGGALWLHGSYWYLFVSSANCCNGPYTGYSVFVGRATTPMGPFLDRSGNSMASVNPGGEEVLAANGNRWLGPGGNVLFTDEAGQDFVLYHAIPSDAPVYAGTTNYTARPALLDPVTWTSDGWPIIDGGSGPVSAPQPAPAAQPGGTYVADTIAPLADTAGTQIASLSDEFTASTLSSQWSTLHVAPKYTFANGLLQIPTISLDSCCNMSQLPMLVETAPTSDYVVETKMSINLPIAGSGDNYAQGDLFIYGDDANFLRLDIYSNATTRQIEFVKQATAVAAYAANNGASNLAAPSLTGGVVSAYLRIVKRTIDGTATYTAYASQDGITWQRGATWTHTLTNERIGLAGGNLAGFTASFDYVHVSPLQ